jgi:hypothetical protein
MSLVVARAPGGRVEDRERRGGQAVEEGRDRLRANLLGRRHPPEALALVRAGDEQTVAQEVGPIDRREPRAVSRVAEPRPWRVEHGQPVGELDALIAHAACDVVRRRRRRPFVEGQDGDIDWAPSRSTSAASPSRDAPAANTTRPVADRRHEPAVGQAADREHRRQAVAEHLARWPRGDLDDLPSGSIRAPRGGHGREPTGRERPARAEAGAHDCA